MSSPSSTHDAPVTLRSSAHPYARRAPRTTPALQLGCMNFGARTSAEEAERIVRRALELGVLTFDTANMYQNGESERILGRALGADRHRVSIATKVGFARQGKRPEGLSREVVTRSIEDSLRRLNTDYVDLYYLHVPDHETPIAETLEGLAQVFERKQCKAWAISNFASWQILELIQLAPSYGLPKPAMAQQLYNLLIRQLDLEYARFAGHYALYTCIYNPLAAGLLSGRHQRGSVIKGSRFDGNPFYQKRYLYEVSFDHVEALAELAKEASLSLVELSYAWLSHREVVDAVIVGPGSLDHLDAAHTGLQKRLDPALLEKIEALSVQFRGTNISYAR